MFTLAPFGLPADYGDKILSLEEVKQHIRVSHSQEDDLIEAFRDAAVDAVEKYTGLILAPRTGNNALVWRADRLPARVRLGVGPVTAVTDFTYLDHAGAERTVDPATLRIGVYNEVLPKPGAHWPGDIGGGIAITFEAGLTDAQRPAALLQAVRMFTAHLYLNREAVVATGGVGGEIPLGFKMLCGPFRQVVL